MAEEATNTPQAEQNSETNPSTQADETKETPLHEHPRFKEVIGQRNQFRDQVDKYQAEEKAKEEKLLQEKGEFQTILDKRNSTIETLTKENEGYKTRELEDRERMIEKVPEEQRVFTEGMSNSVLAQYIEQNQTSANAGKTDPSRAGTTAKGDFGGYSSKMEWVTKDPEGYEKAKKNSGGDKFGDMFMPKPNPFA